MGWDLQRTLMYQKMAGKRIQDQMSYFLIILIELPPDQTRDADQLDTGAMSLAQGFAYTKQAG